MNQEPRSMKEGTDSPTAFTSSVDVNKFTELGLKALQLVAIAFSVVFASGWIVRAIALGTSNLPELETSKEIAVTLGFCFIASVSLPLCILFNIIRLKKLADSLWLAVLPLSTFPMMLASSSASANESTVYVWIMYYGKISAWILTYVLLVKVFRWLAKRTSAASRNERQQILKEALAMKQKALETIDLYESKLDVLDDAVKDELRPTVDEVKSNLTEIETYISEIEPKIDYFENRINSAYKTFSDQWSYVAVVTLATIFIVDFGAKLVPTFPQAMGGLSPVRAEFRIKSTATSIKGFIVAEDRLQIVVDRDKLNRNDVNNEKLHYFLKSDIVDLTRYSK